MFKKIISTFLIWRILLFIPLYFSPMLLPFRDGFSYTQLWDYVGPYFPVTSPLLWPWANFDGVRYLSIAGAWYSNDQGFFPLFPLAVNFFATLFGTKKAFDLTYFTMAFLVANISFTLALWILNKLLSLDFPKKIAYQSILFLLVFPTSFFFASIYSESLFLLLSLLSFYFARKQKWIMSGIFGGLLSATRIVGVAILPALLYEFYTQNKSSISLNRKTILNILPVFLSPLGLIAYMVYNQARWGSFFSFIEAQEKFLNHRSASVVLFPQTIFRYIKIFITLSPSTYEWWVALLEFSSFIFALGLLYLAFKKKVRFSYILFAALCFLIPVSTGTFTGLPRYVAPMFPMFIALALVKNRWVKIAYVIISSILLFILLMLFSRGYYVS